MFKNQTFGAASTGFGSFNTNASTASPFSGFKPTASTSAFGAPPAFGANATPQATTGGGLFGSTNTTGGLFGNTNTPSTFGQSSGFGFGANTSGGGLFSNNAGTGLFAGNQNTSGFGAKPSGFGFGSGTTTGTTGGLFGSTPSTSTGLFGQQSNTLGGTGLFGNTTGGFGQQAATGTAHVKYNPVVGTDVVVKSGTSQNVNIKHHCITCMKEYESKSLEELRLEDYAAGRKGAQGGMFGGFQQTENKPLFGGSTFGQPATTSAPSLFGGGIGSTSGFGQTSQYPCQNMRKHACMPAHPCTHPCIPQSRFNFNCNAPKFCSAHACMLAGCMHVCTCPCSSNSFIDTEKCLKSGTKIHTCMLPHQMFSNNLCNKADSFNEGFLTLVKNSFLGAKMSLELANSTFDATIKTFDYCSGKIMYAREYMLLRVLFNNSKEALDNAKKSFAMASRAYDFSICQRSFGRFGAATLMFTNANKTLDDVDTYIKNVGRDFQFLHFYNAPTLTSMKTAFNSVKSAFNNAKNALELAIQDLGLDKLFPLDFTTNNRYKYIFGMPFNSSSATLNNSSAGFTFFGTGNSHGTKIQTFGTVSDSPSTSCNSFGAAFNSSDGEVKTSYSAFDTSNTNALGTAFNSAFGTSTGFNLSVRSDQKFSDTAMKFDNKTSNKTGMHFGDNERNSCNIKFGDANKKSSDKSGDTYMKFGYTNKKSSDTDMKFDNTGMKFCDRDKKCIDTDMELGNSAKKLSDTGTNFGNNDKKSSVCQFSGSCMTMNLHVPCSTGIKFGNTNKRSSDTGITFGGTGLFCWGEKSRDGGKNFGFPVKFGDTKNTGMKFGNANKEYMHFGVSDEICNSFKFGIGEFKTTSPISAPKSRETGDDVSGLANIGSKFDNAGASSTDKTKLIGTSNTLDTTGLEIDIVLLKLKDTIVQVSDTDIKLEFGTSGVTNTSSKNVNVGASCTNDEIFAERSNIAKVGFRSDITSTKIEKDNPSPEDDSQEFEKGSKSEVTDVKLDGSDSKDSNFEIKDGHESIRKATYLIIEHGKIVYKETVSLGPKYDPNRKISKDGTHSKDADFEMDKGDPDTKNDSLKIDRGGTCFKDGNVEIDKGGPNSGEDSRNFEKDGPASDGEYLKIDTDGTSSNDGSLKIDKDVPNSEEGSRNFEKDGPTPEGEYLKIDKDGTGSNDGGFKMVQRGPNSGENSRNIEKDGPAPEGEYLKIDKDRTGSNDGGKVFNIFSINKKIYKD